MPRSCSLVCFALSLVSSLPAQTTSAFAPVRDNTIYAESGSLSNGAAEVFLSGSSGAGNVRRGLIAFDTSAVVPINAVVLSARLELTLDRSPATTAIPVALHRVTAGWGEAGSNSGNGGPGMSAGNGAPAQAGDATWTMRLFPATAWAQPGGDFVATASATASVTPSSSRVSWTSAQLVADVQAWVAGAQPNHGWIVRGGEATAFTGMAFRSREFATVADRPALVVTWAPAAAVTSIGNGCTGSFGSVLSLAALGVPTVPNPAFAVALGGGPTGPRAYFGFAGLAPVPLPLSATCFVYGDPATLVATTAQQGPLNLPIPGAPALYGASIVLQGLALDQIALLLITSNALELTLGP